MRIVSLVVMRQHSEHRYVKNSLWFPLQKLGGGNAIVAILAHSGKRKFGHKLLAIWADDQTQLRIIGMQN